MVTFSRLGISILTVCTCITASTPLAHAEDKKPNIVIIWGDDIGQTNVSAYSRGLMGYETPNIDRVASPDYASRLAGVA